MRRPMGYFKTAALALIALVYAAPASGLFLYEENAWELFPPPPESAVFDVASNVTINGIPQTTKTFTSKVGIGEVVDFYQREWEGVGLGPPIVDTIEDRVVISLLTGKGYFFTVMVRPGLESGSAGLMNIVFLAKVEENAPAPGSDFPRPADSQVASDMVSKDFGKKSRMILVRNSHSVDYNKRFYISSFKFRGWGLVKSIKPKDTTGSVILEFKRNKEEASIVITDRVSQTTVLTNIVTPE